jgi:hypothetical protein
MRMKRTTPCYATRERLTAFPDPCTPRSPMSRVSRNGFCTYDRQVEKVDQVRVRASNLGAIAAGSKPTTPQAPPATGARRSRPLVIRRDVGDDC